MKFCGAMEVCGLGFPRDKPIDYQWPEVLRQADAQNAAQLICYSRDHKPEEAEFLRSKGFIEVYQLQNPRTGSLCRLWIYTFPEGMRPAPTQSVAETIAEVEQLYVPFQ